MVLTYVIYAFTIITVIFTNLRQVIWKLIIVIITIKNLKY